MTKKQKSLSIYAIMIVLFSFLIFVALKSGISLNKSSLPINATIKSTPFEMFGHIIADNLRSSFMILLIQIIVILFVCRIFSSLFSYIGQPGVIGEILAGIILGPSFLGHFFPNAFEFLFSKASLVNVHLISQIGLILFMFIIGLEVDFKVLKNKINETLVISHAGILVPFFLGILISHYVYQQYAAQLTTFLPFALFIGISMSITAFPVLARIVQERGLAYTPLGVLSIASAANDDITAWCLLAVVIAVAKAGTFVSSLYAIGFTLLYILFMFYIVRPFFRKIGAIYANNEVVNINFVSFVFLALVASSALTELIGIHALFGAFIAGVVMPPALSFRHKMMEKIEDVTLTFFLPLFFAYTGLNTNILLINNPDIWLVCAIFIIVAVVGKFGGCAITARLVGETWHDSLVIGTLMNTRGLMELVALNIGYEMKILPQPIFAVLIIMALVTTFMTTPALHLISHFYTNKKKIVENNETKLMLSFARPESGRILLSAYHLLFGKSLLQKKVIATHFTYGTELNIVATEHYATDSFIPVVDEAQRLHLKIDKRYQSTEDIAAEMIKLAKNEKVDCLLIGAGYKIGEGKPAKPQHKNFLSSFFRTISKKSFAFPNILIAEKTQEILEQVNCTVMILISRYYLGNVSNVLIIINNADDFKLLDFTNEILESSQIIQIYQQKDLMNDIEIARINRLLIDNPTKTSLHQYSRLNELVFTNSSENLIISSYDVCKEMMKAHKFSRSLPSYLGIRFGGLDKQITPQ
jgi:Kef-type K+ transport system membrane component KefB